MFSDMNMFHVLDILKKKMLSNSLLKENISVKCFFAIFSSATRLSACKKLAEFPIKSL